jgi:hypothetical protein
MAMAFGEAVPAVAPDAVACGIPMVIGITAGVAVCDA